MKSALFALVAAAAIFFNTPAQAAEFQLKGVRLGISSEEACGTSVPTDGFGDIIRKNKESAPSLIDMRTMECAVAYQSFGGVRMKKPALLFFLEDELILFKIELDGLSLEDAVQIYRALVGEYGKPSRTKSGNIVTDIWKKSGNTLEFERTGHEWDNNDVIVILRQDKGYRTYQSRFKANSAILNKLDAKNIGKDIR